MGSTEMPDPIEMARAVGLAALAAAVAMAVAGWWGRRRQGKGSWVNAGWLVGIGAGYYLGCALMGLRPDWRMRGDMDRLLGLVMPAVILVEALAAVPRLPRWLVWALRLVVAALGTRVLLHGSVYLAGPGASAWTPIQAWSILGGIAAGEAAVWAVLTALARRGVGASLPIALAITIGVAAPTVMLSGYLSGGQSGLPLAAAVGGAAIVALVFPGLARSEAPIGLAVVGLASVLVLGRFFGELRTDHAILLLAAPLLAAVPELSGVRRLPVPAWGRGLVRVLLVGLVAGGVLADAARRFNASDRPAAAGSGEPSLEDYMSPGQ
jgi:hypothetical protein